MKIIKFLVLGILSLVVVGAIGGYIFLQTIQPTYSGALELEGLKQTTEIIYDDFGVPHIYAENEEDAYFALGYAHAQERLFQMELITRLATGTLSELLGPELIETDKLFRTLDLNSKAESFANEVNRSSEPYAQAMKAYFDGVNSFVANGHTPLEFTLLGIPQREFTVKNSYLTAGVLAFGFAEGFRVDPVIGKIQAEHGDAYLKDLEMHYVNNTERIPIVNSSDSLMVALHRAVEAIPVALWNGSNAWVIGKNKTKSGHVIFENDTHIGFSQPSVWFQAHLEYPGKSFYGDHAAMIPFGILGRNRFGAWGMTMFTNDDVDFFREQVNPANANQYKNGEEWLEFVVRKEVIKVKDGDAIEFEVKETVRGPLMNEVNKHISEIGKEPVSVWWGFREVENNLMKILYQLDHHTSIDEARDAASKIEAPGLNVMYANVNDDIAWWASAKLPIRPDSVNSKTINDGFTGNSYLGYYTFEQNPQSENPTAGYVYSANNQPDSIEGVLYPGYYVPEDRAKRIVNLLENKNDWTVEEVMEMTGDGTSPNHPIIAKEMASLVAEDMNDVLSILANWEGAHELTEVAPTIYYALLSQVIHDAMADELGEPIFKEFGTSHMMKRTYFNLIHNDSSIWWDDVKTNAKEKRKDIVNKAFEKAMSTLQQEYGNDVKQWKWGKAHTLSHPHALGKVKPLDKLFDVGIFPAPGGMAVINNLMFLLSTDGHFRTKAGAAVRTVVSMDDIAHGYTILPTGQSGNLMSPHYDDQAKMFVNNEFRTTTMERKELEKYERKLTLKPTE